LLIKGLDKGLGNATLNTSEQEVLNCGDGDCSGGYVEYSARALTTLGYGLVSEADLPYQGIINTNKRWRMALRDLYFVA
jgi:hypothetical protein